jgi:hypothetical protein
MNRYLSEQLITVEEAERLSELHTGRNRRKQPIRQPSLWAWQSVPGALNQTVTEEQVDEMMRTLRRQQEDQSRRLQSKSGCPRLPPR